jgi:hypothetical protein
MYNCAVSSDWNRGSSLRWSGAYNGRSIDETGEIIDVIPGRLIKYTGFDRLAEGDISRDGNIYITHELIPYGNKTKLLTTLEHFEGDESRAEYAAQQWDFEILPKLQTLVETTL